MNELKRIRILDMKITQFGLSKISGVHPSRISLLENNQTTPTKNEINRISEALGVVPEEIFGLDIVMGRLTSSRKKDVK